jgi:phosphatidylethanolamine N-methyltransferase
MVSQLLDPRQPKNVSDAIVLAIMAAHILLLYALPQCLKVPVFAVVFLFWRACYNVGIGYLLQIQSHHRRLVTWAKQLGLFEDPASGKNPRPWLYGILKRELEAKIPEDYKFEEAPIEYNTWLVFRRVVDLILMCDFSSYCLFAIACGSQPQNEGFLMFLARWGTGLVLFGFNLWVKLDAHRVVKDYAWYWGDFFYLIDQELTFDGVFEMAPHPMYSVGYAGYYGISMMASSYAVLLISVIAHAAQFAFLVLVENPHIEKTYNPPPPRRRDTITRTETPDTLVSTTTIENGDADEPARSKSLSSATPPLSVHNLMGLQNIDFYRNTDLSVMLLQGYMIVLAFFTPSTPLWQALFVLHALAWRLWYTLGLGIILDSQSKEKFWTRHFVKYGESTDEAWSQWKGMYHLSMTMCWASFIAATWKVYSLPPSWDYGLVILRHVVGFALVALQLWTSFSIYESLSEFGWFFGDFFFDQAPKLTYGGIYRYLNNPERIIGLAGLWGAVFISNSKAIFFLALLSHMLTLGFIQYVEKPHMQKLYGQSLRKEAGLTKTLRQSLPPPINSWTGSVDKVLVDTGHFVEEFLDAARPKLAAGVSSFVKDTTALFQQYPARLTVTRLAPDLAGYNPKDYSLSIEPVLAKGESVPATNNGNFKSLSFDYGAPIKVKWQAPANHSHKDWVGLYMVADNASRDITRLASFGRWIPTSRNEYDSSIADDGILVSDVPVKNSTSDTDLMSGEMVFSGDKLFWTHGVFEFRYHHDGKHNVMAISQPFSIKIDRFDEEDTTGPLRTAVEEALLPLIRNCFDRDPEIAPDDVEESFGALVERDGKYAKRVVFAVKMMFGIEFAKEVVLADGNVRNLAWRICNAKKVLVSAFSFSSRPHTLSSSLRAVSFLLLWKQEPRAVC